MGKIPLADATLIEDPSEVQDEDASVCSQSTRGSTLSVSESVNAGNRDFKIFVETKSGARHSIHLIAPTIQDKEAWISDISQCLDNIHMHSLLSPGIGGSSGGIPVTVVYSVLSGCSQAVVVFFFPFLPFLCFDVTSHTFIPLLVLGHVWIEFLKDPSLQDTKHCEPIRACSRTTWTFGFREH